MTYPAWILTVLLTLSMLVSPMPGVSSSELPCFTCAVDFTGEADDSDVTLGLVRTIDGDPAFVLMRNDGTLYLTGEQAITALADGRALAVPTVDLMAMLYGLNGSIPDPTEADVNAIMAFAQSVMSVISPEAFLLVPAGDFFVVELDVDALLADLHTGIPQLLTTHAAQLDPTVQKYSLALTGRAFTCEQLAAMWHELALGDVCTGLTLRLSVLPQQDGSITFLGSVSGFTFIGRVGEEGFDLRFTTPDGVSYQLDSADLATVSLLVTQACQSISSEALSFTPDQYTHPTGAALSTYTITLNSTNLARDLNIGFAEAIRSSADTVNALLNKYRSWIALFDPQAAETLTAASLADAFDSGLIFLPHAIGELCFTNHESANVMEVRGYLNEATLTGKCFYGSEPSGSLLFTIDSHDTPFTLDADYHISGDCATVSLTSSRPILDAFSTITLMLEEGRRGSGFCITTDTNVFRMAFNAPEQYMELKVGPFNAYLRQDASDVYHVNVYHPEFFADLQACDDFVSLDSTFVGLDFARSRNDSFVINGYVAPDTDNRYDFGLNLHESGGYMGRFANGYLIGNDVNASAVYVSDSLYITVNGELYSVVRDSETSALLLCYNHGICATIYPEITSDLVTLRIYRDYAGKDNTLPPLCTVTLDPDPAPLALPSGAQSTDADFFIHTLTNLLQ